MKGIVAEPRLYGERISKQHLSPINKHVQDKIVLYHNYFRANVSPAAKDMLLMVIHPVDQDFQCCTIFYFSHFF